MMVREAIKKISMNVANGKQMANTCLINHAQLRNKETEMRGTLDWNTNF